MFLISSLYYFPKVKEILNNKEAIAKNGYQKNSRESNNENEIIIYS